MALIRISAVAQYGLPKHYLIGLSFASTQQTAAPLRTWRFGLDEAEGGQNSQPTMTRMSQSDFSMEPEQ